MSILSDIINKVFSHPLATQAPPPAEGAEPTQPSTVGSVAASVGQAAAGAAGGDVQSMLSKIAEQNPEHLDWQHSIVDLLKLIGHDSSLAAQEKLADELHYPGDKHDTAAMNEFLLHSVMQELKSGKKVE